MEYAVGIGAANVDIYGSTEMEIRPSYDHPASIRTAAGGVTRNIMENVARLGVGSVLLSAVGDDMYGDWLLGTTGSFGVDTGRVRVSPAFSTGTFMQVQDRNNDMYLAMCDMSVMEEIAPGYVELNRDVIAGASALVIDPSLREDTLRYVLDTFSDSVPVYLDTVSDHYAEKMRGLLKGVACVKPNRTELERLSGMAADSAADLEEAAGRVLEMGARQVLVSLGEDGCLYMDRQGRKLRRRLRPVRNMVNASGAGDSFFAAFISCRVLGHELEKSLDLAMAAGAAAVCSESAVHPQFSFALLEKISRDLAV